MGLVDSKFLVKSGTHPACEREARKERQWCSHQISGEGRIRTMDMRGMTHSRFVDE